MYWTLGIIYVALAIAFITDVLRQPATALSPVGKVLWILALLLVPVLAWIVYGTWRLRQSRSYS